MKRAARSAFRLGVRRAGVALAVLGLAAVNASPAARGDQTGRTGGVTQSLRLDRGRACGTPAAVCFRHVLLLSIDGLHGIDLDRYVTEHPGSALAALTARGVTFASARTTGPSDSFPGLLAVATGAHPATTGVYYDDSYDKTLYPAESACAGPPGSEVAYTEAIDADPKRLETTIDPAKLPMAKHGQSCVPVFPHDYLRVNTIFEVVRGSGGYTAWSDKHPAYDFLNGPSGHGVDDLYAPEIASTNGSLAETERFDETRVGALLRELRGRSHDDASAEPVPNLLGMNFQSVSVAQKDPRGGYTDAKATPSAEVAAALDFVDRQLGRLVAALDSGGLRDSTMIVVEAKHGQAPIDPARRRIVDQKRIAPLVPRLAFATLDDIALLWLHESTATTRASAIAALQADAAALAIDRVYDGKTPPEGFGSAPADPRAPDLIVQTIPGAIYAKPAATKAAEHGGLSEDDRDVALLVSYAARPMERVTTPVETTQVAPTILRALGLDPRRLQGVAREGTRELPSVGFPAAETTPPRS